MVSVGLLDCVTQGKYKEFLCLCISRILVNKILDF